MLILFIIFILPQLLLIKLLFGWRVESHSNKEFNCSDRTDHSQFHSNSTLSMAYECLGVSPQSTDDEIKSAYRRLAMTYHPDRYATQGAEAQAHAQTKFLKIQQAYEEIKKMRNIV